MSAAGAATVRVGTAGWRHRHWRGAFYPDALAPREWLRHYAGALDCVEVQSSAHQLPSREHIAGWVTQTPESFRFAVRAPRAITHWHKLKGCEADLAALQARLGVFEQRLGAVVFELPARWRCNLRRLEAFLPALPAHWRCVFGFADESWYTPQTLGLLAAHGAGLSVDPARLEILGAPPEGALLLRVASGAHPRRTAPRTLGTLERRARDQLRAGHSVWVIFEDAGERSAAPRDAQRLRAMLAGTATAEIA